MAGRKESRGRGDEEDFPALVFDELANLLDIMAV
jgi:hypothetical protein